MPNRLFVEGNQIALAFGPGDMSAGANNGAYVSFRNYERIAIVLIKAAGTAGDNVTLTVQQAKDVSGTAVKALPFTRIDVKKGTLTSIGDFTTVTQAAANTYTDASGAASSAIYVVEFEAVDLDINNGFNALRVTVPDVGTNTQYGVVFYVGIGPRSVPILSAIVD